MTIKKVVGKLHRWLGLLSGLVILFLGVTGCLLAFQKEVENATQWYRFVRPEQKAFLPPSKLKAIGAAQLPGKHLHAVLYEGGDKAAQVIFFQFEPEEYYYIVYVNPYSGEVIKVKDMNRDFFRVVTMGHYYLWLPPRVGQPIVASATLIFAILLISGLVLWWPRNKAARKQRFSVKWNARWRRKNYDLHNVLGFYATWVAIILAFTGLIWGFQWFAGAVHHVAGGLTPLVYQEPLSDTTQVANVAQPGIDLIWQKMKKEHPEAEVLEVHIPATPASPIAANANPDAATYWQTDYRYFDQFSLQELPAQSIYGRFRDAVAADKLIRMNYDLHTGAIWGLPGKILMFFASLIAASLPVTGFWIWWGRNHKKKKAALPARPETKRVPVI